MEARMPGYRHCKLFSLLSVVLIVAASVPRQATGQATPLVRPDLQSLYERLLRQIDQIRAFDHHGHPGYWNDPDVDAMTIPPSSTPFRLRESNPELIAAAQALFGYPYSDLTPEHARWLT